MDEKRGTRAAAHAEELAARLGHRFHRPELLAQALTHSSWANERGAGSAHNERLEFLGDAVLELCVSTELFRRFPKLREGELTRLRAHLVSTVGLAQRARELGLDAHLRLGKGEEQQGGRTRDAILSDALEAVLAAVYEDGGFAAARDAVARIYAGHWPLAAGAPQARDAKSRLQEAVQHLFGKMPVYAQAAASGPEHAKHFQARLMLPDGREFAGQGTSMRKAERDAAARALEALFAQKLWPPDTR
ncbi:ribonuclease III [Desulfovibrio sp.]|uniref:ribonuclease III n=1 Tax=Desulfovibrio sp. TaxID=885 RepID=UPI0023D58B81|nr:ribonuclease III [Desulfovibrio sp.]MDE7241999.1 ribonuclease III [Desulfovibrio sp.]